MAGSYIGHCRPTAFASSVVGLESLGTAAGSHPCCQRDARKPVKYRNAPALWLGSSAYLASGSKASGNRGAGRRGRTPGSQVCHSVAPCPCSSGTFRIICQELKVPRTRSVPWNPRSRRGLSLRCFGGVLRTVASLRSMTFGGGCSRWEGCASAAPAAATSQGGSHLWPSSVLGLFRPISLVQRPPLCCTLYAHLRTVIPLLYPGVYPPKYQYVCTSTFSAHGCLAMSRLFAVSVVPCRYSI